MTANQFVSAAEISGGKLTYTPATGVTGGPLFMLKFQVQDNGGTARGGVDLDSIGSVLNVNSRNQSCPSWNSGNSRRIPGHDLRLQDNRFRVDRSQ